MTPARILEEWEVDLPEPVPDDPWFLDWALQAPRQSGIHLTAGWHAYQSISDLDIESAREYFGGLGVQSLVIDHFFDLSSHVVLDNSPAAVAYLGLWGQLADSFDPRNTEPAELVGLDFGDLTVWKAQKPGPHFDLIDRVFTLGPKAVVLTDVAGPRLHLHRKRYETLLGAGSCADYPTYLAAFARYIEERWGYGLVAGYYHRWSTVMALVPGEGTGVFTPTPDSPVGLVLM